MSLSSPLLSLLNGTFRLGERLVFENTSWEYRQNQQWAIIGANGSGKSLFGDALRGRLPLVQGDLEYHFTPEPGLASQDCIGLVSFERRKLELQDVVAQSRWNSIEEEGALRVSEILDYQRVMEVNPFEVTDIHRRARPRFEQRRRRAIAQLRVEPFLERTLMSLSNGEMQRVQLARALCRPSRLLILDEPFAGLDRCAREHFHAVLGELMRTPIRLLLIVTRREDLPRGITHLLFIDNCRVAAAGPAEKILAASQVRRQLARQTAKIPSQVPLPSATPAAAKLMPGRELVRMRQATVRYGDHIIFSHLDWTIRERESWALLGPNGSGKTTLLSLILGDHPQVYNNDVTVFGIRRGTGESVWEIKRRIGWFSPELLLHFDADATCFEVVASGFHDTIGLFEAPTPRQRAAVRRILAEYNLAESLEQPLCGLSAGLQRIVLLLRALVKTPRLLILDEPCHGLDRAHREFFIRAVDAVIRSGVTVIYVTHRKDEIPPSVRKTLALKGRRTEK